MPDEKLNLSEHVTALFEGVEGVTNEQKTKMETVLEAAVASIVTQEREAIQESVDNKVNELMEAKTAELDDTVSKYLDYVVTEWVEDNRIAIESGLKLEMAESFFDGMKQLFVEHNVEVPEGKEDLVASYENTITELEGKLNESTAKVIEMGSELEGHTKAQIVAEAADGLTDTQKEKFDSLIEGVEFSDESAFASKVQTIRESYFKSEGVPPAGKTSLNEDINANDDPVAARRASLLNPYSK